MPFQPLKGIRVLDLSRLAAGALATKRLADLGADVVKIEDPRRGDYLRTIPPLVDGVGIMHRVLNRGKRSVTADLTTEAGVKTLSDLASRADVIVEVSRSTESTRAIDLAALHARRPQLVICTITGFGPGGPLSELPAHGMNMDAWAGILPVSNDHRGPAIASDISISVELGGVNAALAIASALVEARRTGRGEWIEISCWDAAVEADRVALAFQSDTGQTMPAVADLGPLYDVYITADNELVMFGAIEERFWVRFCEEVGRTDLIAKWSGTDVDFGSDDLASELVAIFASETAAVWEKRFVEWGIPASIVLSRSEVLKHPHTTARALVRRGPDGVRIASPIKRRHSSDRADSSSPAPGLGEDTDAVLAEWLG
ncbi:CaiB/BaiF CoA-transferase family protein [Mycobacterium sp. CVI_P3]|uniref:CaiB/BaiF CoA-transferase family protein n=1 Tax=Mycobacterium pinniadriaticum TaxID=2994102 RepID=A0ABT3SNC5_9MYCO|nr:CaiB/BaiF CoA-transferase family protein [Mycobacterium pinniadriaticum]MCX2934419.1 CaiB/BaiF CoA-transferase family protein [Mycobacterium pinniadriaticum]MCX2940842.1 CaiB/BaiF CoA-transferase family protein [Mycobacterium pinniadriaticum]